MGAFFRARSLHVGNATLLSNSLWVEDGNRGPLEGMLLHLFGHGWRIVRGDPGRLRWVTI